MFVFDTFQPGKPIGTSAFRLDRDLVEHWFSLYPEDRDGDRMPAGMTAVVLMRAYANTASPRPPGNVHGGQRFNIVRLPRIGDPLVTALVCDGKELKNGRRWVRIASETRRDDGTLLFTGLMTTLWAK